MIIPTRVRRAIKNSYLLSLAQAEVSSLIAPIYKSNPLIIYQMGKVGSEAVERTLAGYKLNRPVYRAHSLVKENLQNALKGVGLTDREYYRRSDIVFRGHVLSKQIARDLHRGHWQVISMVRDPIAQNVSSFFQLIDLLIPNFEARNSAGTIETAELMKTFLSHYPPNNSYINWFDDEMKRSFEIDVFASSFSRKNGYKIYRKPHVELLVMRLEDLDRCAPIAFDEFLGIKDFRIRRSNQASSKSYSALYEQFRKEAEFPVSFVDGVYKSKYARTFYSSAEIDQFRARITITS